MSNSRITPRESGKQTTVIIRRSPTAARPPVPSFPEMTSPGSRSPFPTAWSGQRLAPGRPSPDSNCIPARRSVDLRTAKEVIAHGEFRTRARFKPCKRRERHHGSAAILYIELAHILRVGAVLALCLDVDLPLPAKTIEVVY